MTDPSYNSCAYRIVGATRLVGCIEHELWAMPDRYEESTPGDLDILSQKLGRLAAEAERIADRARQYLEDQREAEARIDGIIQSVADKRKEGSSHNGS